MEDSSGVTHLFFKKNISEPSECASDPDSELITKSFIHYSNKVFNESFIGLEGTVAVCERVNDKILDYIFINSNPDSIIYLGYGFGMGSSYYSLSDQDYNKVDLYSHSGYVENNYSYQKIIFDQLNQFVVVRLLHELYPDLN